MPTPAASTSNASGIGAAIKRVAAHASSIVRLKAELTALELKKKAAALGLGIALALSAAFFAALMLGFLFATIAAALATFLATWLALLVVTTTLLVLSGALGLLALGRIKRGSPPVPAPNEREELAKAVDALRGELGEAANLGKKLKAKLPLVAGGAASAGFVAAGGIGATMRYLARRGRDGRSQARADRFAWRNRG